MIVTKATWLKATVVIGVALIAQVAANPAGKRTEGSLHWHTDQQHYRPLPPDQPRSPDLGDFFEARPPLSPTSYLEEQALLASLLDDVKSPRTGISQVLSPGGGVSEVSQHHRGNVDSQATSSTTLNPNTDVVPGHQSIEQGNVHPSDPEGFSDPHDAPPASESAVKRQKIQRYAEALRQKSEQNFEDGESFRRTMRTLVQSKSPFERVSVVSALRPTSVRPGLDQGHGDVPTLALSRQSGDLQSRRNFPDSIFGNTDGSQPTQDTTDVSVDAAELEGKSAAPTLVKATQRARLRKGERLFSPGAPKQLLAIKKMPTPMQRDSTRHTLYEASHSKDIQDLINKQVFKGKLTWIDPAEVPQQTWPTFRGAALEPNRALTIKDFPEVKLGVGRGTIRQVRMTIHGGSKGKVPWREGHVLATGHRFLMFWGVPEGKLGPSQQLVQHYGAGYLEDSALKALE